MWARFGINSERLEFTLKLEFEFQFKLQFDFKFGQYLEENQ
jgi:hypothetical protein